MGVRAPDGRAAGLQDQPAVGVAELGRDVRHAGGHRREALALRIGEVHRHRGVEHDRLGPVGRLRDDLGEEFERVAADDLRRVLLGHGECGFQTLQAVGLVGEHASPKPLGVGFRGEVDPAAPGDLG